VCEELLLRALRSSTSRYPALASIPLYVRHNRARAGHLAVGDPLPDVAVTTLDGTPRRLLAHLEHRAGAGECEDAPARTLLIAGSIS